MRKLLTLLLIGLSCGAPWASWAADSGSCPAGLRIAFLDRPLPPLLNGQGPRFETPPGQFVDWVQQTVQQLGCRGVELVRVPQRRLVQDTAANHNQITMYLAYTPERAQQLAYPLRGPEQPRLGLALGETHLALYALVERQRGPNPVRWDGQRLLPDGLTVGVVRGGVEEPLARAAGWKLDLALSHTLNAAKLRRGQVDVALMPALSFTPERLAAAPALVALAPTLGQVAFFAPVSPQLRERHPVFVERFWLALCRNARGAACTP